MDHNDELHRKTMAVDSVGCDLDTLPWTVRCHTVYMWGGRRVRRYQEKVNLDVHVEYFESIVQVLIITSVASFNHNICDDNPGGRSVRE